MSVFRPKKPSSAGSSAGPKRTSTRSVHLLREFMENGEDLGLVGITVEFPDAIEGQEPGDCADKYKHIIFHVHVKDGIYAGGTFRFEFDMRDVPNYPFSPPKVTCLTKVWHPNIALNGRVCHNVIQNNEVYGQGCGYSPALHICGMINSLSTMFDENSDSFNSVDPLNAEAAKQYDTSRSEFTATVKRYVREYAQPVSIKKYCLASKLQPENHPKKIKETK